MTVHTALAAVVATICVAAPTRAFAQRFPFERTIALDATGVLDVTTIRGTIDVVAGGPGRVVISGTVTVRVGWNVPTNAETLARQVAGAPPIDRIGNTIRLGMPSDPAALRAVIVAYQVRVPPNTDVQTTSESGATTIRGVGGTVRVQTQSSTIELESLAGAVEGDQPSVGAALDPVRREPRRIRLGALRGRGDR